jgi:leucyl aminopeptidase
MIKIHTTRSKATTILLPVEKGSLSSTFEASSYLQQFNFSLIEKDFEGSAKDFLPIFHNGMKIMLVGLGEKPQAKDFRTIFRSVLFQHKKKLTDEVVIDLITYSKAKKSPLNPSDITALAEAYYLSLYDISFLKTQEKASEIKYQLSIEVSENELTNAQNALEKGRVVAEGVLKTSHLINIPSNRKTALKLAEMVQETGKKAGFEVNVILGKEEITKAGFFALKAVNQGSVNPPAFIIMEYNAGKNLPKVGLVGKGITFDTGGISIKDSQNMYYMKSDMGGAAAVIGIMQTVAQLKLPVNLIGIVPATDNMPDGGAMQPSDVIDSYSGLTIEVEDTDAEGRLILADGLAYLEKNFKPEVMIDLATLTGSSIAALGYFAGALFTNNELLANKIYEAGQKSDNRVWRMPLWDDYNKQNHSDVADVKNLGGPAGGSITAAKFLEKFTNKHTAWAHLDIAGVAYSDSEFSKMRSGTGFGVRLIVEFLEDWLKTK